ncbi:hypothetical protein PYW07_001863 [Mythimna separata]|uniref:Endonuclease-reverse transcriptase n=1 Tax=Mythimna separata TaxID=271217 RepID=A0AAD8DXC6_MYTSE|nr:hypothetical protein PYW07_001863 [Mythimna separata]
MDKLMEMLLDLKKEIAEQKEEIKSNSKNIVNEINDNMNHKFQQLCLENEEIQLKLEKQNSRLDYIEKEMRKKNIVIFGVEETEKGYFELQDKILGIMSNILKISCIPNDIEAVQRRGKKVEGKVRPVVITFTTLGMKIKALKNKNHLENCEYYIKQDYPKNILEKRAELKNQAKLETEKGNKVVLKYDKLIILENKLNKNKYTGKPGSPEKNNTRGEKRSHNNSPTGNERNRQNYKKNKTQSILSYVKHSPTPVQVPSNSGNEK